MPPALAASPRPPTATEISDKLDAALELIRDLAGSLAEATTLIAQVDARCARLELAARPVTPAPPPTRPVAPAGEVATDADLDSKYGDPDIRRDPPRWIGATFAGCRYSETTPDYLDCVAGFLDWAAGQAEAKGEKTGSGQPRAPYLRKDAARARGWAARLAARGADANAAFEAVQPSPQPLDDDDMPF